MNEEKANAIVQSLIQAFASNNIELTETTLEQLVPQEESDESR